MFKSIIISYYNLFKEKKFDISIIGGGPKGLYLGYLLIKKGYKIKYLRQIKAGGHANHLNSEKH